MRKVFGAFHWRSDGHLHPEDVEEAQRPACEHKEDGDGPARVGVLYHVPATTHVHVCQLQVTNAPLQTW